MSRSACFPSFQQSQKLKVHLKLIDNNYFQINSYTPNATSGFLKKQNPSLYLYRKKFKRKSNAIQKNKKQAKTVVTLHTQQSQNIQKSNNYKRRFQLSECFKSIQGKAKLCSGVREKKVQKILLGSQMKQNNQQDIQLLLRSNSFSKNLLIGHNIKKIQKQYHYDRYQLYEMYSNYKSLVQISKGSIKKFIFTFELILNMHKISLKQEIIKEEATKLALNLSFNKYLDTFFNIQILAHKMAILDYLEIVFQNSTHPMTYHEVQWNFRKRCNQIQAQERTQYIFTHKKLQKNELVNKSDIISLCLNDQQYQRLIYKLYLKELKSDQNS